MQANAKRRVLTRNAVVVGAGSVCRTKMKMEEVKGGSKVTNNVKPSHKNDGNAEQEGNRGSRRLRRNQSDNAALERRRMSNCARSDKEDNSLIRKSYSDLSNSPKTSAKNYLQVGGQEPVLLIGDGNGGDAGEGEVEEKVKIEVEEEEKSSVDKKMDLFEQKPVSIEEEEQQEVVVVEEEEEEEEEEEVNDEHHEIPVSSQDEEKNMSPVSLPSMNVAEKKQNPVFEHRATKPHPSVLPHFKVAEDRFGRASFKHNRMQSLVNLIMWRDVSRSAFVFGSGTFFLVSSSYAKDINFSLISASSYVGLFYLAFVFLCKSILRRGEVIDCDERDESYMVGEEEAIWLLKMLLPYVNELLAKLRSLFSGDPATTLKLALLLFVLARSGSSITIWSLAKMTFFGVFTIPRICSSYSSQLANFGKFWLERFRDGWESCSHKKAVSAAMFILVWNISSTVARIWTFFMVVVAVKLYQQCVAECGWRGQEEVAALEEDEGEENSTAGKSQGVGLYRRQRGKPVELEKMSKAKGADRGVGKRTT
ncbi:reticulon-like protein B21 isoform X1 [Canna indica]|uniref:Reticulon-like protein n=1 Tax=Canna indica TaxID=4628 RepID=A0AAQ3QP00_9LILI|nr:reticulon-like protein B21 isoform X1 [Canna indica]